MSYPNSPRPYLLCYSGPTREEVRTFIDGMRDVPYWYAALPNAFLITATVGGKVLADRLRKRFGESPSIFITPLDINSVYGYMPASAWHVIRNPERPFDKPTE